MFKNFFNKNKTSENQIDNQGVKCESEIGLNKDLPILIESIPLTYSFLDRLKSVKEGIRYERIGPVFSESFPNPIDKYDFYLDGHKICSLFIYSYHNESIFVLPEPFKIYNADIDSSIFDNITESPDTKQNEEEAYLIFIINSVLLKNGQTNDEDVIWNDEREKALKFAKEESGYEESLEQLILDEWFIFKTESNNSPKSFFIAHFLYNFHNQKLSKYTPTFIQERNQKIEQAYSSIIETVKRIQMCVDNEKIRTRIEIHLESEIGNLTHIYQCSTPFCLISLWCDTYGRLKITYALDPRITEMLLNGLTSTLIRRMYEFTANELEAFIDVQSFNSDCIDFFEKKIEIAENNENFKVLNVDWNEDEFMNSIVKIDLREDIDEESKKWLWR